MLLSTGPLPVFRRDRARAFGRHRQLRLRLLSDRYRDPYKPPLRFSSRTPAFSEYSYKCSDEGCPPGRERNMAISKQYALSRTSAVPICCVREVINRLILVDACPPLFVFRLPLLLDGGLLGFVSIPIGHLRPH